MYCGECGTKNKKGARFCVKCGYPLENEVEEMEKVESASKTYNNDEEEYDDEESYEEEVKDNPSKKVSNKQNNNYINIPPNYQPISMWGYFGYEILFSIPFIGWLLLIIFALGGTPNINVRNFARSYFCFLIILVVLLMIFAGSVI